jgi:hypothetical protein
MAGRGLSRRTSGLHREGFCDPGVVEATRASILGFAQEGRGGPWLKPRPACPRWKRRGPAGEFGPRQPTTGKAPLLCEPVGDSCDGHGRQQRSARAASPAPSSTSPSCSPPPDPLPSVATATGLDVDRRGHDDPPVAEHARRLLKAAGSRVSGADVSRD